MTNEIILRIVISAILAIAMAPFIARIRRSKGNVFCGSSVEVFGWSSFVFTLGVWFFLILAALYTEYGLEGNGIIIVFFLVFWLFPFFALINVLFNRYKIKDKILIKKLLFSKDTYIDIGEITSIEYVDYIGPTLDRWTYYLVNMSDSGCYKIDDHPEGLDKLFYRMGQINNNINFKFKIYHTGDGSFFARLFNGGTFMGVVVYAVGFYLLLGHIMRTIGVCSVQ